MRGTAFESAEFFETCAMLITFICLGKYLECAAKGKTSAAIAALMGLAPPTALLLTIDATGKVGHLCSASPAVSRTDIAAELQSVGQNMHR